MPCLKIVLTGAIVQVNLRQLLTSVPILPGRVSPAEGRDERMENAGSSGHGFALLTIGTQDDKEKCPGITPEKDRQWGYSGSKIYFGDCHGREAASQ